MISKIWNKNIIYRAKIWVGWKLKDVIKLKYYTGMRIRYEWYIVYKLLLCSVFSLKCSKCRCNLKSHSFICILI